MALPAQLTKTSVFNYTNITLENARDNRFAADPPYSERLITCINNLARLAASADGSYNANACCCRDNPPLNLAQAISDIFKLANHPRSRRRPFGTRAPLVYI